MQKTESPIKLNLIDSFELPDGSFDYFLRKNETIETRIQESIEGEETAEYQVYAYDEVYFNSDQLTDIEENFESYFSNPPEKKAEIPVDEQLRADVDYLAIMTGVEL